MEVRLIDDSTIKVQLREERIELVTAYGKLLIPVASIRRIDFGLRFLEEERRRIETGIADLGHKDYQRRQAATAMLDALREKAYPALVQAAKGKDQEVVRRAEQLLEKLRDAVPAENLEIPPFDVVHTEDSKIAGQITLPTLRIHTLAFGEQPLKLVDVRSLRTPLAVDKEKELAGDVLPDPGFLGGFQGHIGKTVSFRVTAPMPLAGALIGVFGTDVYTMDSSLAGAALHAGALRPGQTGIVRVTFLGPQPLFQGSMRNGIMSQPYGPWPGFRIELPKNRKGNHKE